jgi:hypothetical protein
VYPAVDEAIGGQRPSFLLGAQHERRTAVIEPLDVSELPPQAQKILGDGAPAKLRMVAARGIVPGLKPAHIATVLAVLAAGPQDEVQQTASKTLDNLPPPVLNGALDADLPALTIDALVHSHGKQSDVVAKLLRMPRLGLESVEWLAKRGDETITELVATNQERLLEHPRLIELLYMNKNTRMSTADRIVEFAVRNGIEVTGISAWKEAAEAIEGELIPEGGDEPLPEDIEFWEAERLAASLAEEQFVDAFVEEEDGKEVLEDKYVPLYKRIADMSVSQKVRRAMLGTKEERALLVREQNRLVAVAAARSEQLQEPEAIQISRNRNVISDVLRVLGTAPTWLKCYQIKLNLVENPRTPPMVSQRLIIQLRESDLRKLAKNKNVQGSIRQAAGRHLSRRKK